MTYMTERITVSARVLLAAAVAVVLLGGLGGYVIGLILAAQ